MGSAQILASWVPGYLEAVRTDTFSSQNGATCVTLDFPGTLPAMWVSAHLEDGPASASPAI